VPGAFDRGEETLPIAHAPGASVLLYRDRVEEEYLGKTGLFAGRRHREIRRGAYRLARFLMASSYFFVNLAMNSTASGEGLGADGSTLIPSPSEVKTTSCPTPRPISSNISGGIGSITEPPTFLNVRLVCTARNLPSLTNKTKYNSLPVRVILIPCLLYFFADPVQSDRGYENTLRLFELRSSSPQVARTLP
jgi:hypothetical protein